MISHTAREIVAKITMKMIPVVDVVMFLLPVLGRSHHWSGQVDPPGGYAVNSSPPRGSRGLRPGCIDANGHPGTLLTEAAG
jgi:hypothetical protein